jgi:hypothetical protein
MQSSQADVARPVHESHVMTMLAGWSVMHPP